MVKQGTRRTGEQKQDSSRDKEGLKAEQDRQKSREQRSQAGPDPVESEHGQGISRGRLEEGREERAGGQGNRHDQQEHA